jgi:hypothetical protein
MFRAPTIVPLTPEEDRRRIRRQWRVMGGLLLTLAGLLFAEGLLPTATGALEHALPILAIALGSIWLGGILLGGAAGRGRTNA